MPNHQKVGTEDTNYKELPVGEGVGDILYSTRSPRDGGGDGQENLEKEQEIYKRFRRRSSRYTRSPGEGKGDTQDHWRRKRRYTRSLEKEKEILKITGEGKGDTQGHLENEQEI